MTSRNFENFPLQGDEIEALKSIYGTDFHIENYETNFSIEINERFKAKLEVTFPPEYPTHSPPIYMLSAPWLKGPKRQELCSYLEEIYLENIGDSIIYLWVERIREFIFKESVEDDINNTLEEDYDKNSLEETHSELRLEDKSSDTAAACDCPEIFSGDIITDRKSHFQPHLAAVNSVDQVKMVLKKLYDNKKIANATHNMYAYRFRQKNSILCQDCEDDGEANAGGRMLHLLQILDAEGVVVVVSRWYGGIQLGPDRFKHINNAARQILVACGYVKNKEEKKKRKKR